MLRYLSEEAVVVRGREHSTARGVWEVCVDTEEPRSNWRCVRSFISTMTGTGRTSVRSEVLPEPLGPRSRIDGRVVSTLALKTTVWRKIGIDIAIKTAIISPIGDGLRRACAQSCIVDIFAGMWLCEGYRGGCQY